MPTTDFFDATLSLVPLGAYLLAIPLALLILGLFWILLVVWPMLWNELMDWFNDS